MKGGGGYQAIDVWRGCEHPPFEVEFGARDAVKMAPEAGSGLLRLAREEVVAGRILRINGVIVAWAAAEARRKAKAS
jgi:hypothetical protein